MHGNFITFLLAALDDSLSPVSMDDDWGSFSLFDGYVEPVISPEVKTEEEDEEVVDEELELQKRWKGTLRTTFDKYVKYPYYIEMLM